MCSNFGCNWSSVKSACALQSWWYALFLKLRDKLRAQSKGRALRRIPRPPGNTQSCPAPFL